MYLDGLFANAGVAAGDDKDSTREVGHILTSPCRRLRGK